MLLFTVNIPKGEGYSVQDSHTYLIMEPFLFHGMSHTTSLVWNTSLGILTYSVVQIYEQSQE